MAIARKWANVAVAMQSALAAPLTITAISKASPGVATSVGHGLANGAFLLLRAQGMFQVDNRVVRVAGVAADTFQLEGIDTTDFDTFTSGTAEVITFGTSITSATEVNASGGDFNFIDTTTIHANAQTQIPGVANPSTFEFTNIWDVSDPGLGAMKAASDTQGQRAFRFTFGTGGQIMVFTGYVGATLLPGGQAQGLVTTPTVITMYGTPTYYAS